MSTKKFKAKKTRMSVIILIFGLFILVLSFLYTEHLYQILPLVLPLAFFLWSYFNTNYSIDKGQFIYRSGFIKGQIDVKNINQIISGTSLCIGLKPALSRGGLLVKYNNCEQVYIAPTDSEAMIRAFLAINPSIQITASLNKHN